MKKRIYLAGKIARGDWRHEVVSGLRRAGRDGGEKPWPTLRAAILGRFDYVGPFFISCDHGGFHGPGSHGVGANPETGDSEGCCDMALLTATDVVQRCVDAIDRADLFYAWLDDVTAFGTLAEIGHATGVGTCCIVVATPEGYAHEDEFWFALHLPGVLHVRASDPAAGLNAALELLDWR